MRIIVSIVSHFHHDFLINLGTLKSLSGFENIIVICRDNIPVPKLKKYCEKLDINYVSNAKPCGFSQNNNQNFLHYKNNLSPQEDDYFLILNPDIVLTDNTLSRLNEVISLIGKREICTINLFLDNEFIAQDDNIRRFPSLKDFIGSFLFKNRRTIIKKKEGLSLEEPFWVSGAFMLMHWHVYEDLKGFNELFYMYCEDIELCRRAIRNGISIRFIDDISAVHFRRRKSQSLFSKHFIWHIKSVVLYQLVKFFPKFHKSTI